MCVEEQFGDTDDISISAPITLVAMMPDAGLSTQPL